jgi:hypothetical protein
MVFNIFTRWQISFFLAACVPGIADPTITTCNPDGSNPNVTAANYSCNPAIAVKVAPPLYCQLLPSMPLPQLAMCLFYGTIMEYFSPGGEHVCIE